MSPSENSRDPSPAGLPSGLLWAKGTNRSPDFQGDPTLNAPRRLDAFEGHSIYEDLFALTPGAAFLLDSEGFFVRLTETATRIAKRDDLVGQHFLTLVPESQYELTGELFRRVMSGERLDGELLHIVRGDGRQRLLTVDATGLKVDGVIVGVFGVVRDISDHSEGSSLDLEQEVSLNELIRFMEPVISRALGPRAELALRADAAPDSISVERAELEQLILDLVLNARSALAKGGLLSIRTSYVSENSALPDRFGTLAPGSYVALTVTDDGEGMDAGLLQGIFGDASGSETKSPASTLQNAKAIVTSVGAHLSVLSESRIGTVFRVYFPAATPDDSHLEPLITHAPAARKRILVVDDDEFVRRNCGHILEQAGYAVVQTSDGEQAVKTLSTDRDFAAAIVDVVLPTLGGRELAALLRQKLPSLPVVFTASYSEEMIERHRILGDAPLYVQKPFTARELLSVTSLALAQPL